MGTRTNTTTTGGGAGAGTSASSLRARYARSSTVSVTQLLTDSCSSLLNRLTSRVRGPSTAADKPVTVTTSGVTRLHPERDRENIEPAVVAPRRHHHHAHTHTRELARTTSSRHLEDTTRSRLEERYADSTRSRLEDKYSAALERYSRRKEKSTGRSLTKSATTHSVLLAEKAYPYVSSSSSSSVVREKTPYRSERHRRQTEARSRPLRTGTGELSDSRLTLVPTPLAPLATAEPALDDPSEDVDRKVKRKEIQSLIMKYTGVEDDASGSSALARCQQKYSNYLAHKPAAASANTVPSSTVTVSTAAVAAALPLPLPLLLVSQPHISTQNMQLIITTLKIQYYS